MFSRVILILLLITNRVRSVIIGINCIVHSLNWQFVAEGIETPKITNSIFNVVIMTMLSSIFIYLISFGRYIRRTWLVINVSCNVGWIYFVGLFFTAIASVTNLINSFWLFIFEWFSWLKVHHKMSTRFVETNFLGLFCMSFIMEI